MNPIQASATFLLCVSALIASCGPQPSEQPAPSPPTSPTPAAARAAGEAACPLPLRHFNLHGHHELTGSRMSVPSPRVGVDRTGRFLWNHRPVGARLLNERLIFWAAAAAAAPPDLLWIRPDRDAPCAAVQRVLNAAIRFGRCSPGLCTFDWERVNPEAILPPPPDGL